MDYDDDDDDDDDDDVIDRGRQSQIAMEGNHMTSYFTLIDERQPSAGGSQTSHEANERV